LKIDQTDKSLKPSGVPEARWKESRRCGIAAFTALAVLLSAGVPSITGCQGSNPQSFSIGPSKGEIIGATVGITAAVAVIVVVAVEVHRSHHTLRGCLSEGPSGPELRTSDAKMFALEGDTANLKAGDMVKFHGSKLRKTRDAHGDQVFRVESVKRDYGPCPAQATP
jgi:hypothetical protein